MKPTISTKDYYTLRRLINYISPGYGSKEINQLEEELNKATVLDDDKLKDNIVKLNSHVEMRDEQSGKITSFKIVLPEQADFKANKISVLAPIAIALIGFKEGDKFKWQLPGGLKSIRIVKVEKR